MTEICFTCGSRFYCGKSAGDCWCAKLIAELPPEATEGPCRCPPCLRALVAANAPLGAWPAAPKREVAQLSVALAYLDIPWMDKDTESVATSVNLPLGLGCVRSYASSQTDLAGRLKFENYLLDEEESIDKLTRQILRSRPHVAAFSYCIWNARKTDSVVRALKVRRPGLFTVLGGPEIPRSPESLEQFLRERPYVDAAIPGEGEKAFADILRAILGRSEPVKSQRLERDVRVGRSAMQPCDLRQLHSPYLTGDIQIRAGGTGILVLETCRGCSCQCSYCDYWQGRGGIRPFPIARLRLEMAAIRKSSFQGVLFLADSHLNWNLKRGILICRILASWRGRVIINLRPDRFSTPFLRALGALRAPCLVIGIQSTHPATLRNIRRPFNPKEAAAFLTSLHRYPHVNVAVDLILGLPGDDYASFCRSFDWALSFPSVRTVTVNDCILLRNTQLERERERFSIRTNADGAVTSNCSFSSQDMRKASWLYMAYRYLQTRDPQGLIQLRRHPTPSIVLQRIAMKMRRYGKLGPGRALIPWRRDIIA